MAALTFRSCPVRLEELREIHVVAQCVLNCTGIASEPISGELERLRCGCVGPA
jgi:hypothetical protein